MPGYSSNNNLRQTSGQNGAARCIWRRLSIAGTAALTLAALGCSSSDDRSEISPMDIPLPTAEELANRAYVISNESNELFIVDLSTMQKVASVDTSVSEDANGNHMAMVSKDGGKIYISAAEQGQVVVVDARTLEITKTIELGTHPTHSETCFSCPPYGRDELW